MKNLKKPARLPRKAPSNQTGGTAWGKKLAAEFSRMAQSADMKKLILLDFPYIIAFYMVEKAAWLYRHCNGDSVMDRLMVLFMNFGLAYKSALPSFHPFDLLASFLPAGTLSGAPKIRAMEIIEELESVRRGLYGGATGYVDFSGDMDFCITIRTMIKKGKNVYLQAGAGIVADSVPENEYHPEEIFQNPIYMPSNAYAQKASAYLEECIKNQDSSGGIIECVVTGMPVGIGDTVFEKLDANLAKAMLSIGAVKGFEIGDGFKAADTKGSINNDSFHTKDGRITKDTNHAGGVLGGMSDGSKIIFRAAVKPTPSISQPQSTVTKDGENTEMIIKGRHDPVIVPRAVVVVESMAAITILDLLFTNMSARMDKLKSFYGTDVVALF